MTRLRVALLVAVGLALASMGWALLAQPRPVPLARLEIEVLNGCGDTGLAQRAAQRLQALGQVVTTVADAEHHDFAASFLIDRRGKAPLTRRLADTVGPCQVVLERTEDATADVTLVLGRDWPRMGLFARNGSATVGR